MASDGAVKEKLTESVNLLSRICYNSIIKRKRHTFNWKIKMMRIVLKKLYEIDSQNLNSISEKDRQEENKLLHGCMLDKAKYAKWRKWIFSHMVKLSVPVQLKQGKKLVSKSNSGSTTEYVMKNCNVIGLFSGKLILDKAGISFNPEYPENIWVDNISYTGHKTEFLEQVLDGIQV